MTFEQAAERPFETVISGPVAGAVATAELARQLGLTSAIAADVGGTSFDTCLITDGQVPVLYQGQRRRAPHPDAVGRRPLDRRRRRLDRARRRGRPAARRPAERRSACRDPPATGAAAASRRSRTPRSCSACSPSTSRAGSRSRASGQRRRSRRSPSRLGFDSVADVARGTLHIAAAAMADAIREHHGRAGARPARGRAGRVRRRRAAVRHAHGRRARHRHDRDPRARRQLLGLGAARRRPRADGLAHAPRCGSDDAAVPSDRRSRGRAVRRARDARAARRACSARCTSTSATSARSTR